MLTTDQVLGKGRYRILSSYASDAMGGLYEAYDTVSNTHVVLRENVGRIGKIATATQLDAINEAFRDEARVLSEIRHESLLSVQDYFSEIDRHYLVMESVDGYDLTKLLDSNERPPALNDVLSWADQILDALNYLHNLPKPRVHRDIRPANIRLTSSFKVKLVTSGISANEETDVITPSPGNPADTAVLSYRPLEQLWGGLDPASQKVIANSYDEASQSYLMQPLDARTDLYSLGATLYHILTRTLPKDALERSIEMLEGNPDPLVSPHQIDTAIPNEISEVLMRSLSLKREDRFESAAIMRQALRTAQVRIKERRSAESAAPRARPEPLSEDIVVPIDRGDVPAAIDEIERERMRVEQRRMELEAEQNRLEEERARLEQKRLEFEAEEKRRSEQRRLEIEADLRRQRQEADRIKAVEQEAAEKAKLFVAAASTALPTLDDAAILELEVEPAAPAAPAGVFEWSEEELAIPPSPANTGAASADVRAYSHSGSPQSSLDFRLPVGAPSRRNRQTLAIAAALMLVVAIAGGWMFLGSSSSEAPGEPEPLKYTSEPQAFESAPIEPLAADPGTGASQTEAQQPSLQEPAPLEPGTAASTAASKSKPKRAAPSPARSPAAKKAVTVDDIISDN